MTLFSRPRRSFFNRLVQKLPWFAKEGEKGHSLAFLNVAQFGGVLNDNIFKLVLVFLLIEAQGAEKAGSILSAVGAIFVIPFLLFSSTAGVLADRFSKQRLLIFMKAAEMIIMLLAIFAFAAKSAWAGYTLLFLLSTHSAMFGPSKYGIIPEIVPTDKISKANGLITGFTYLAIIIGTFLASFLTDITDHNFPLVASCCLCFAIIGFLSTFGVARTEAQGSKKKLNFLFIREIYHTLLFSRQIKHLFISIFGAAFFLCIGAFTQLNIIPFAMQALGMSEVAGGYLFLTVALGIALGSFIAGKASRKRVELGLPCLAGVAITILLAVLGIFARNLISDLICLILLGICGGLFIVPFDSYIQLNSPDAKRGQVIAAANFLSFTGVLIASFALFLFSEVLGLSSANGFIAMALITLVVTFILSMRLSDLAFHYFGRKILKPLYRVNTVGLSLVESTSAPILVLNTNATWLKAFLVLSVIPNVHILVAKQKTMSFPWFNRLFYSIHVFSSEKSVEHFIEAGKNLAGEKVVPCLFMTKYSPSKLFASTTPFRDFFLGRDFEFIFVQVESSLSKGAVITFSKQ